MHAGGLWNKKIQDSAYYQGQGPENLMENQYPSFGDDIRSAHALRESNISKTTEILFSIDCKCKIFVAATICHSTQPRSL